MRSLDMIGDYVKTVCRQIRWKKAHTRISDEMENHIKDGRDSYIAQGLDEQAATEKAIVDTGDAMIIGTQFDSIHRPKPQWSMFVWIAGFLLLGILISVLVFDGMGIYRRLFWTAAGMLVMIAAYFADFTLLGKYPKGIFVGIALSVWAMFFLLPSFHIGGVLTEHIFSVSFFPTIQVMALLFPVALVPIIFAAKGKGYRGLIICVLAYGLLCFIAFAAPALAGLIHFAIVGMALLIIAIMKNWFGVNRVVGVAIAFVPYAIILAIMVLVYAQGSWITRRLVTAFNPHSDPMGAGFLALQVRELLSGALVFGEGTTPNILTQSWLYSDFILLTVISRFGWLVFGIIMVILMLFMGIVILRCVRQKSGLGFFVSIAIALTFFVQVFMYLIFNMGLTIAHISLPLISPGSFAMVINLGLIGFMLSVFRTGDVVADKDICSNVKQNGIFSWHDRKLTINFKMKAE